MKYFTAGQGWSDAPLNTDATKGPVSVAHTAEEHLAIVTAQRNGQELVVSAAGVPSVQPFAPPTSAGLLVVAQRAFRAALAKGQTFNVAASGQPPLPILCDGSSATRDDLAELADFGTANPSGTRIWLDNAGVAGTFTGAQFVTLDRLARAWISATYAAHATLLAAITANPPTITTTAQVDAFAWPTA